MKRETRITVTFTHPFQLKTWMAAVPNKVGRGGVSAGLVGLRWRVKKMNGYNALPGYRG